MHAGQSLQDIISCMVAGYGHVTSLAASTKTAGTQTLLRLQNKSIHLAVSILCKDRCLFLIGSELQRRDKPSKAGCYSNKLAELWWFYRHSFNWSRLMKSLSIIIFNIMSCWIKRLYKCGHLHVPCIAWSKLYRTPIRDGDLSVSTIIIV